MDLKSNASNIFYSDSLEERTDQKNIGNIGQISNTL